MSDYSRPANVALMLFLALCGISIPPYRMGDQVEPSRHVKISADIFSLETQLGIYQRMNGFYPTTEQGIDALVTKPASDPKPKRWRQLFQSQPRDPWQHEYIYQCPGRKNPDGYDLFSAGADGKSDTADDDWGGG